MRPAPQELASIGDSSQNDYIAPPAAHSLWRKHNLSRNPAGGDLGVRSANEDRSHDERGQVTSGISRCERSPSIIISTNCAEALSATGGASHPSQDRPEAPSSRGPVARI